MTLQDTAPSAVRIAEAIDTIICTANLMLSFLVMNYKLKLKVINYKLLVINQLIIIWVIFVATTATGITAGP